VNAPVKGLMQRRESMCDWEWTELKVHGDTNVKDLNRILAETAAALKGTSQ